MHMLLFLLQGGLAQDINEWMPLLNTGGLALGMLALIKWGVPALIKHLEKKDEEKKLELDRQEQRHKDEIGRMISQSDTKLERILTSHDEDRRVFAERMKGIEEAHTNSSDRIIEAIREARK